MTTLNECLADWSGENADRRSVAKIIEAIAAGAADLVTVVAQGPLAGDLGLVLGESRDGDGQKAIEHAEKAVAMTGRKNATYLVTLAAAYAEGGQFDLAVKTQKEAMAVLKDETDDRDLARKLDLYEAHKPFRDAE